MHVQPLFLVSVGSGQARQSGCPHTHTTHTVTTFLMCRHPCVVVHAFRNIARYHHCLPEFLQAHPDLPLHTPIPPAAPSPPYAACTPSPFPPCLPLHPDPWPHVCLLSCPHTCVPSPSFNYLSRNTMPLRDQVGLISNYVPHMSPPPSPFYDYLEEWAGRRATRVSSFVYQS
jgi:hypothetical protein